MKRQRLQHVVASALVAGALAAGCGSDPKPEAKGPDTATTAATSTAKATTTGKGDTKSDTSGSIHVDDKITKLCGDLPTAHFAFDSADIQPDVEAALSALAKCFTSGPAKGKGMKIEGHADPRGTATHNMNLGQKRAGSVQEALAKRGVENGKMEVSSRGALEASGTDESGWALDRKVMIFLAE